VQSSVKSGSTTRHHTQIYVSLTFLHFKDLFIKKLSKPLSITLESFDRFDSNFNSAFVLNEQV